jgi:transcriptional regulator with XRE-family HTH domain
VEIKQVAAGTSRPDPEVQAGRALRRLRLARGWSQEEVARLMEAYGYDFHQTMIAKIESAQRPLRVRELADFAALYAVEVSELIYAPSGSLQEVNEEVVELQAQLEKVTAEQEHASMRLRELEQAIETVRSECASSAQEAGMLSARLQFLRQEAARFAQLGLHRKYAVPAVTEPLAVASLSELGAALRLFREQAGRPGLGAIQARSGGVVSQRTIGDALRCRSMPSLHAVDAVVTGCGGSEEDRKAFANAWRRINSA